MLSANLNLPFSLNYDSVYCSLYLQINLQEYNVVFDETQFCLIPLNQSVLRYVEVSIPKQTKLL